MIVRCLSVDGGRRPPALSRRLKMTSIALPFLFVILFRPEIARAWSTGRVSRPTVSADGAGVQKLNNARVVVVGKIILDVYGAPADDDDDDGNTPSTADTERSEELPLDVKVGGGGPQAAWGAAAALACLSFREGTLSPPPSGSSPGTGDVRSPPPHQPVTFLGPVGSDWTDEENSALMALLGSACDDVLPVRAPGSPGLELVTPRIRIWHDDEQNVFWRSLNGSFGPGGADGLWRDRPSAADVLAALDGPRRNDCDGGIALHIILEAGEGAAGGGMDGALLLEKDLGVKVDFLGVEPIAHIDGATGAVSGEDARSCADRILGVRHRLSSSTKQPWCIPIDFVCPDVHLYEVLDEEVWTDCGLRHVAVRDGERGSVVLGRGDSSLQRSSSGVVTIPAAALRTRDSKPVNPTGAGNAYSAAVTACLARGTSIEMAACVATAVGAAVCEYEHLPPWSWEVLVGIAEATDEVEIKTRLQQPVPTSKKQFQ